MKKRILVIENDRTILDLISIVLNEAGYEAHIFTNEQQIFDQITDLQPDAILLDIVKPTVEGTELCRRIKEAEGTSHIPIIVLSTHPHIKKVKDVCADEVVPKPFDIDGLIDILQEQLKAVS
jgi:DNA-binding response OmpR family regulator